MSAEREERDAVRQHLMELPDEALLELLGPSSRRSGARNGRIERRLVRALLYQACAVGIVAALSRYPWADPRVQWILDGLGVGAAAMLVGIWSYIARSVWSYGKSEDGPRLPFPMYVLLAGRTDGRFLPHLLAEMAFLYPRFERSTPGTDRVPPDLPLAPAFSPIRIYRPAFSPHESVQFRRRYRKILRGILLSMGQEEQIELSDEERYGLVLLLQIPEEDVELTVCLLKRLEQWGDAQAVPVLKQLIREKHWYVGSEQVEEAARRCLERIKSRLRQQKQDSALLRPAQTTDAVAPHSLLRPASEESEAPPEQLLRPGNSVPPEGP